MIVYIDDEYKCHINNDGTMRKVDIPDFDNKCPELIEAYKYYPSDVYPGNNSASLLILCGSAVDVFAAQERYEKDAARRFFELGIPRELIFAATTNYPVGSFLAIHNTVYKTIRAIPSGAKIDVVSDVVKSSVEEYIDAIKEG